MIFHQTGIYFPRFDINPKCCEVKHIHILLALEILEKSEKTSEVVMLLPIPNLFTWIHRPDSTKHLYGHLFKLQNPVSAAPIENASGNRAVLRPDKSMLHVIFHSDEIIFSYRANTIIKISPFRGAMTDTFLLSALKAQSCFYNNRVLNVFSIIFSDFRKINTHSAVTYKKRRMS